MIRTFYHGLDGSSEVEYMEVEHGNDMIGSPPPSAPVLFDPMRMRAITSGSAAPCFRREKISFVSKEWDCSFCGQTNEGLCCDHCGAGKGRSVRQ